MHAQNGVEINDESLRHFCTQSYYEKNEFVNIEMCRLHLDEIMYRSQYPDTFDSLVRDIAFFTRSKIAKFKKFP